MCLIQICTQICDNKCLINLIQLCDKILLTVIVIPNSFTDLVDSISLLSIVNLHKASLFFLNYGLKLVYIDNYFVLFESIFN